MLPLPLRFVALFTTASFLVSLLSWSRGAAVGHFPSAAVALVIHMLVHGVYGAVAALPTRRRGTIFAMALSAMLIDVDHLAYFLGWPVPVRTSHSIFFMLLAPMIMAVGARAGLLGPRVSPRLAASMAFSTVLAHLAWDSITGGEARVPFWLPFSAVPVTLSALVGGMMEIVAVGVMWWAAEAEARRSRRRLPGMERLQS